MPIKSTRLILLLTLVARAMPAADWPTYAHDPQRSGWAFQETKISPQTVAGMKLGWKTRLKNEFSTLYALTAPVTAGSISTARGVRSVVYVAGIKDTVFALDAETGEELWTHKFKYLILPGTDGLQGTFLCPNGITSTPVIDTTTGILYVIAADGSLYGLDLGSGRVRYGPVQFVAPHSKSWSLNLVDGTIYTVLSQGCGNGLSGFYSIDVRDRHHPVVRQMLLSNTNTAGIWGRGGPIVGTNGRIYGATGDGMFDPVAGDYSNSVVAVSQSKLDLVDYFLPPNWLHLKQKDFDLGSASPAYLGWRNRNLLIHGAKEGLLYLMDADSLGGQDHQTTLSASVRIGNDKALCCDGLGFWGTIATARDREGRTWLYMPLGGPLSEQAPKFALTNGDAPHGSIIAFQVVSDPKTGNPALQPEWVSGDFDVPDPPVIANGVVFAVSTGENPLQRGIRNPQRMEHTHPAVLRALDAATGKELYNSGSTITSWMHFSGLAVADGRVFAVDHDSNVYCFVAGK